MIVEALEGFWIVRFWVDALRPGRSRLLFCEIARPGAHDPAWREIAERDLRENALGTQRVRAAATWQGDPAPEMSPANRPPTRVIASARCLPNDRFDPLIGQAIALRLALLWFPRSARAPFWRAWGEQFGFVPHLATSVSERIATIGQRGCETQHSITAWADATFGPARSPAQVAGRANEEMRELIRAVGQEHGTAKIMDDCADVVIVLYRLAALLGRELQAAIDAKMATNRERCWDVATGQHIRESWGR